jgi:hypothetical protein
MDLPSGSGRATRACGAHAFVGRVLDCERPLGPSIDEGGDVGLQHEPDSTGTHLVQMLLYLDPPQPHTGPVLIECRLCSVVEPAHDQPDLPRYELQRGGFLPDRADGRSRPRQAAMISPDPWGSFST